MLLAFIIIISTYSAFLLLTSPSHDRHWQLGVNKLPYFELVSDSGSKIFLNEIRNATYDEFGNMIEPRYFSNI
jgi:hypothetical protein